MFDRLQKKWKVSGLKLAIIIVTFAIGGSLTGYAGKKIMNLLPLEKGVLWIFIYVLLITIIWPLAVLLVSIPFGQFYFFKNYIQRVARRLGVRSPESIVDSKESIVGSQESGVHDLKMVSSLTSHDSRLTSHNPRLTTTDYRLPTTDYRLPTHLAVFASGAGSNAQKIIDRFRNHSTIKVSLIVCNKPGAGVLAIAEKENIPALVIEKEKFFRGDAYVPELKERNINFIVLAGFLWKIPVALIKAFSNRIINIHPALLPKYGGKGMYGHFVHEAVIAAGDKESGITIHYVDEMYDHGKIIFQEKCTIVPGDTPDTLAQKIHDLEHKHFPVVIEELLTK